MQVTVSLQDNYTYLPVVILILAVFAAVVLLLVWASKEKRKPKEQKKLPQPMPVNPRSRAMELKRKYDRQLLELEEACVKGEISGRKAYQKLSRLIRGFAHEMTGIKVSNYTLSELRGVSMPQLTSLIEECYTPEFAQSNRIESEVEIKDTIRKARKVISEWI